jgi:Trypsin-co-occurring domain 2
MAARRDVETTSGTPPLFVKELIRRVHQELEESRAEREAVGGAPIFEVERLTVEANFVAVDSSQRKGALDFRLITVGGARDIQQQQVHKITLSLLAVGDESSGTIEFDVVPSRFRPRERD